MLSELLRRFETPDAAYSPKPFWFLNGDLNEQELTRQLEDFKAHGIMGAILHPRIGIPRTLTYMSPRFIELIGHAVKECARLGMQAVLYDEGMYPSGSACGQVVAENPRFASRGVRLVKGAAAVTGDMRLLARYAITLADDGCCTACRILTDGEQANADETLFTMVEDYTHGTIRGIHDDQEDGMPNAPASADILNPEAVQCFIRLTHDKYYQALAPYFGNVIQAMFVDEPGPTGRNAPADMRAWTMGLEDELPDVRLSLADLPALWLKYADPRVNDRVRMQYNQLINQRLGSAFYGPIQQWCHAHGIGLTGHPHRAGDIGAEKYFDIPGQDLVWRWVAPGEKALQGEESTQAICAYSAAVHSGKERVSNECFGCCGPNGDQWSFTVDDMLFYLNWLFARGTNMIYPHAFLYACDTKVRFGDRPPDVGPNNIWWPWYKQIADYITRCCSMLTWGKPAVYVAILCSESDLPWKAAADLLQHQVEFVYLPVSTLLEKGQSAFGRVMVNGHDYHAIICEDSSLLDDPDVEKKLAPFNLIGGLLVKCDERDKLYYPADCLHELPTISGYRNVTLEGDGCENIRAMRRWDGKETELRFLFNEGETPWEGRMYVEGGKHCICYDPWTGSAAEAALCDGYASIRLERYQALIFVTSPEPADLPIRDLTMPVLTELPIDLDWHASCERGEFDHVQPGDWQQWPGMELYCGEVTYTARFTLDEVPAKLVLDLGQVRDLPVVSLNGHEEQALLRSPFVCDVTADARPGENLLTVRVLSCLTSHYDYKPCPAGLMTPVKLLKA